MPSKIETNNIRNGFPEITPSTLGSFVSHKIECEVWVLNFISFLLCHYNVTFKTYYVVVNFVPPFVTNALLGVLSNWDCEAKSRLMKYFVKLET